MFLNITFLFPLLPFSNVSLLPHFFSENIWYCLESKCTYNWAIKNKIKTIQINMKKGGARGKCCIQIPEVKWFCCYWTLIAFSFELPDRLSKTRHLDSHCFYVLKGNVTESSTKTLLPSTLFWACATYVREAEQSSRAGVLIHIRVSQSLL